MGTKFNFNYSVCTDREQSEKLLALGLKKETADMCHTPFRSNFDGTLDYTEHCSLPLGKDIPAWSLHRLIEMMPYCVEMYNKDWCLQVSKGYVRYASIGREKSYIGFIQKPNTFDAITSCIEWLIKEGCFNKEYLNGND